MASINVNLSQGTVNTINALDNKNGSSALSDSIDVFFLGSYAYGTGHPYYNSTSASSNSLRLDFPDGAHTQFSGVALDNPNATSGHALATSVEEYLPSYYKLSWGGSLNYNYSATANGSHIEPAAGTITAAAIQTLLPTYSSAYDATMGNVSSSLAGNIDLQAGGGFSGVVTSITNKAEHFLPSSAITGTLNVSGNATSIGQGLGATSISGIVNSLENHYSDGSAISVSDVKVAVTGSSGIDESVFANAANFGSDDTFNLNLPASLGKNWTIAAGAGNDSISASGGGGQLAIDAGTGNDRITVADNSFQINGGDGIDTLFFANARSGYTVHANGNGYDVGTPNGGADKVSNVERLHFKDVSIALDVAGNGGQAYRIYQAAFNRAPDSGGLGFWIDTLDKGVSLVNVAKSFVQSDEFTYLYGAAPSNTDLVKHLYTNVLHREADAGGLSFWVGTMDSKANTAADVLALFSESPENQNGTIGIIGNGFAYTPMGG
jgi:hypothetical protein